MLVDAFGRTVTDIRVSVTKRCNFGCIYCHDEGLGPVLRPRMPHEDEMTVDEIERLLRIARELGIRPVKLKMVVVKHPVADIKEMIYVSSDGDGLKLEFIQSMVEFDGEQECKVDMDSLKKRLEVRVDRFLLRELKHQGIYLFNGAEV